MVGLGEIEKHFISKTNGGLFFPFLSIREISQQTGTDRGNTHRYVKELLENGVLVEHHFNEKMRVKRYQMSRDYYINTYTLTPAILEKFENKSGELTE